MLLRVVLDTNIIISAALTEGGFPSFIVSLALNKQIQLYLSENIYKEYEAVFLRPRFKTKLKKSKDYLIALKKVAIFVQPKERVFKIIKDYSDNKLLECALEAKAQFLVTGNKKHFNFEKFKKTQIVTPRQFMELIIKEIGVGS